MPHKKLIPVAECAHGDRERVPGLSACPDCGMVGPEHLFVRDEAPTVPSVTEAQLAALDDDGGPPVSIPDIGAQAVVEGCPSSPGWRSRLAHTGLSSVPVVITTWEPYA